MFLKMIALKLANHVRKSKVLTDGDFIYTN
jgi:hypothetical protein